MSAPLAAFAGGAAPGGRSTATLRAGAAAAYPEDSTIVFQEPKGSYPFLVGSVVGFLAQPSKGTITVLAQTVSQTIAFTNVTSTAVPGIPVLSGVTEYYALGALAGVVAVVVVVEILLRSRNRPQPVPP